MTEDTNTPKKDYTLMGGGLPESVLPPIRPYVEESVIRANPMLSVLSLMDSATAVVAIHPSVIAPSAPPKQRRGMSITKGLSSIKPEAYAWAAQVSRPEFYLLADPFSTAAFGLQGVNPDLHNDHMTAMMDMLDCTRHDSRIFRPYGNRFPSLEALLCPRTSTIAGSIFAPEDTGADPIMRDRAVTVTEILRPFVQISHAMARYAGMSPEEQAAEAFTVPVLERMAYEMAVTLECAVAYMTEILVGTLSVPVASASRRATPTYMDDFNRRAGSNATDLGNMVPIVRALQIRHEIEGALEFPQAELSEDDRSRFDHGLVSLGIPSGIREHPALVVLYGSALGASPTTGGGRRYEGARKLNPLFVRARAQAAVGCALYATRGEMREAGFLPPDTLAYDMRAGAALKIGAATTMPTTGMVPSHPYVPPVPDSNTVLFRTTFAHRPRAEGQAETPFPPRTAIEEMALSHIDLCKAASVGADAGLPPFVSMRDSLKPKANDYILEMVADQATHCCATTVSSEHVTQTWVDTGSCSCGREVDSGALMMLTAILRGDGGVVFTLLDPAAGAWTKK